MFATLPPTGSRYAATSKRRSISMAGVNHNLLNGQNKRAHVLDHKVDRSNVDTPQNIVSITTINLAPPMHVMGPDYQYADGELYAPFSRNPLANVPVRGDYAMSATTDSRWMSQVVTSSMNPYAKAVPIFTCMGGVPSGLRLKYVGLVGNAGMGKKGCDEQDKWGQVYGAGAVTGRNTGPGYIPPLTLVYVSPFPYTTMVQNGAERGRLMPGYSDSSEDGPGIDKFRPATFALNDTDTGAFFHHAECEMTDFARDSISHTFSDSEGGSLDQKLCTMGIHRHLPAFAYAQHYAYVAKCRLLMETYTDAASPAEKKHVVEHLKLTFQQTLKYWKEYADVQKSLSDAIGGPEWDTQQEMLSDDRSRALTVDSSELVVFKFYTYLLELAQDVYKISFAEQINFLRAYVIGRSRYSSTPGSHLDYISGYAVN